MEADHRQLYFITLGDDHDKLKILKDSVLNDIHVIPYDKTLGNISKIVKTREYVESATHIRDTDVIVYIDGYDELCKFYDKKRMMNDFIKTGKDIIIGAEKNFANAKPHLKYIYERKYDKYSYKFLNAGSQIGFKGQWVKMMKYIESKINDKYFVNEHKSDQMILSEFFVDNLSLQLFNMDLDVMSVFFATHPPMDIQADFDEIESYFIHITALSLPENREKYDRMIEFWTKWKAQQNSNHSPMK
jgi:hypothetical protein